jgi:hypothetical protein
VSPARISLDPIMSRLPNVRIISTEGNQVALEAELKVYLTAC